MDALSLPVTSLAAVLNGAILLALTVAVIRDRRAGGVVMGDDGNRQLAKRIRGQANAAEQMPIALILLALSEAQGANGWWLALVALVFTAGRAAHGAYFAIPGVHWTARFWGMLATLAAQLLLLLTLGVTLLI